jgi:predicted Rossmann fold flavoprotein
MAQEMDCVIIGGGASGFFFAANYAKRHPAHKVCILEKSSKVLQKVEISGGGRCNVTHAEFFPKELTTNNPRGERELIGPFHKFMTGDMMAWLEERGVKLKIEDDGRIFPVSDDAQTIIDCFLDEVRQYNVEVCTSQAVKSFEHLDGVWKVQTKKDTLIAKELVISTGSSLKIWDQLKELGHNILPPVPSLFTLVVNDPE